MIHGRTGLRTIVPSIVLGCLIAVPAVAAPGDPFGGNETGCAPTSKIGIDCAARATKSLHKLRRAALGCHLTEDGLAFKTGSGSEGFGNAQENCELGPSTQSAKAKFDVQLAKLATFCDPTLIANVTARRDVILGDASTPGSLDSLNARVFCDATSGVEIAPGENIGFVPTSASHYKCSVVVAKLWSKLDAAITKCHLKQAISVWAGKPFDVEACEVNGEKSALARYGYYVDRYVTSGICPPCLADPMAPTSAQSLGTSTVGDADTQLQEVYVCPGP
jgi:hypothetical protein